MAAVQGEDRHCTVCWAKQLNEQRSSRRTANLLFHFTEDLSERRFERESAEEIPLCSQPKIGRFSCRR
jgi:hypothetical protein